MKEPIISAILFYFFAFLTLGSAFLVVYLSNIMRAALSLLFSLIGVAALYALMAADFLATAQVLIYVGGILILILFGVMLTQRIYMAQAFAGKGQVIPGAAISLGLALCLIVSIWSQHFPSPGHLGDFPTTGRIGRLLLTRYILPFEVASVLLLVALIGAAFLARKEVK